MIKITGTSGANFEKFYKRINFDVNSQVKEKYEVNQNDTRSRGFYVKIIQDNKVITPTMHEKLTFYGKKSDGTSVSVEGVLEDGIFRVDLPNQTFTSIGTITTEFTLRGSNNETISIRNLTINVNPSFSSEAIESTDEFTLLQQALSQIAGFAGEIQDVQVYAENIMAEVGDISTLTTAQKDSLVNAVNELKLNIDNLLDSEQLNILLNAKVDKDTLGDMSQLETEEKEVLVLAINELFNSIEEVKEVSDVSTLLPLLNSKADKSTTGDINNLIDFEDEEIEITNLVEAVNYLYQSMLSSLESLGEIDLEGLALSEDLGNKTTLTTTDKTNLVNAINEINTALKTVESVTDVEQLSILLSGKADKSSLGNLSELTTTQKNNVVAAINEINALIGDVDLSEVFTLLDGKVNQEDFDSAISAIELNLGSHSSDGIIENYTNEYKAQVNVSEDSSATGVRIELLINISESEVERWEPVDMGMIHGDLETNYLVDGAFIYAKVRDMGDFLDIMVMEKDMGADMGMELYPVKIKEVLAPSQVNASNDSTASGGMSQVNASNYSIASGGISQVNASNDSTASGGISQVNASSNSEASGYSSQVNTSTLSTASGVMSQVNASSNSEASGYSSQVNTSSKVINNTEYSSAWGYADYTSGGDPSTKNIKIHLLSQSGDINHSGVLNSGHNFTDYAELFPNKTGEAQGYGLIQTLDGHGVRPANAGDQVVGVTSATAGVVLGETPFSWQDRWLKDEWGAFIMEDVVDEDWEPRKGQTEEDRPVHRLPKENPDYDHEREYTKRQERLDEWSVVGLVGQVYVRLDENVQPMDYVKPLSNGVGQTSSEPTNIRVMKITQEFDEDKGYKIGFCLLK